MDVVENKTRYREYYEIPIETFWDEMGVPFYGKGDDYSDVCPDSDNPVIIVGFFQPMVGNGKKSM